MADGISFVALDLLLVSTNANLEEHSKGMSELQWMFSAVLRRSSWQYGFLQILEVVAKKTHLFALAAQTLAPVSTEPWRYA